MATRIEKIYKTNSLKLIDKIQNFISEYKQSKKKIGEREKEFLDDITTEIDYFVMRNNITDEEIRKAAKR